MRPERLNADLAERQERRRSFQERMQLNALSIGHPVERYEIRDTRLLRRSSDSSRLRRSAPIRCCRCGVRLGCLCFRSGDIDYCSPFVRLTIDTVRPPTFDQNSGVPFRDVNDFACSTGRRRTDAVDVVGKFLRQSNARHVGIQCRRE
jgi:hypothetical protein